ncbi:PAS domain S-box protein [Clostridium bovifaecis]|uniref:histidine kinase n=1 Tax=Clostridium bovifaecis TaxID=2184719 RepID=A0A6I6ERI9_9CLOT|nr:PAS domain S-box protein [Clostridium bovifaecis]
MGNKCIEENKLLKRRIKELEDRLREAEGKLYNNERTFKSVIDLSPNAVYMCRGKKMIYANRQAVKIANTKNPQDIVDKKVGFRIVNHPHYEDEVKKRVELLLKEETRVPYLEQRLVKDDGSVIYGEVAGLSFLEEGEMNVITILRETTERKLLEEELKENNEFYSNLIESLPDAVFFTASREITFTNAEGVRLLGAKHKEELIGKEVLDFVHPTYREEYLFKTDNRIFKKNQVKLSEGKLIKLDGTNIDVDIKSIHLLWKDQNIGVVIVRDVTEKKRVETVLRQSECIHRKFIDLLPIGASIHDGDKIEFINRKAAELLGASNEKDVIGKSLLNYVHPDYIEASKNILNNVGKLLGEDPPFFYNKILREDGKVIDIETWAVTFYDNKKLKTISVFRDVTDLLKVEELKIRAEENIRLLEEERELNKLRTEFFANLSHELKTPLNVILGSQQLLSLYLKDNKLLSECHGKVDKHLKILRQNCNRLLRLINNLIDITKIDSGFFEINMKSHDIINVIEEITLSVAEYIESNDIKLIFDTEVEEKKMCCDADKIERIILNLLSNAIKFTEPGGTINVNIYDKKDKLVISIKDTGIGIPEDKLCIIFDRFRQVDDLFTRTHEGSGIGLALVKSLVEMHGGTISVYSEVGEGSEFIIKLPINQTCGEPSREYRAKRLDGEKVERIQVEFADIYSL